GWAADNVRTPAPLEALVKGLLHNVALFENLEEALNAVVKNPELAAATLRGEYISHEGILFGGNGRGRTDSLLERKARIDAIAIERRPPSFKRNGTRRCARKKRRMCGWQSCASRPQPTSRNTRIC